MAQNNSIKFGSYHEANQYFDNAVEQYFKTEHDVSDTVDFFLRLGNLFTTAGQTYLAKASIGAADVYVQGCK
jgi:hypothetical protein